MTPAVGCWRAVHGPFVLGIPSAARKQYHRWLHVPSETEEGLERLRAVVRANPRSTAFVALAHALCDSGLEEEAEDVARQGLGQHPHLVTGQVALGRALIARGRVREAQERLVDAAKSSPENGDAFRWLGELVLRRGQPGKARVLLEYAEELVPGDARVAELLTEAGGIPQPRQSRPKTDFENTRVGSSQALRELAERMHEDPPAVVSKRKVTPRNGAPSARGAEEAITAEFEPHQTHSRNGESAGRPEVNSGITSAFRSTSALPVDAGQTQPDLPHLPASAAVGASAPAKAPPKVAKPSTVTAARRDPPVVTPAGWATRLQTAWQAGGPGRQIASIAAVVVVLGGLAWLFKTAPTDKPHATTAPSASDLAKPVVAAVDITAAIAAGTHDGLAAVRALGKRMAEMQPVDSDQLAAAGFAAALLVSDYGGAGNGDALEMTDAAAQSTPAHPGRTALIEASRALAALSAGKLADAQAAAARALGAGPDTAEVLFAQGRIALRTGNLAAARTMLQKAIARPPVITSAVVDLATAHLDGGDGPAAETVLLKLLGDSNDLRAHLLLAEAERLLGKPVSSKGLRERCRDEGRESPSIRTWCAAETALAARVAGDRSAAVRAGRTATAGGGRNPRALAHGALVLANLGELEAAKDALRKIRDDAGEGFVPRIWTQLSLALGRGEIPAVSLEVPKPWGPEARLVTARVAYARAGKLGLREFLSKTDPAFVALDPDLAALALLADEAPPDASGRAALEERADKGSGLAAYVLGRLALAAGDPKAAAPRLHRALQASGEACEASRLLLSIAKKARPAAVNTEAKVAALVRAHGGCAATSR